MPGVDLKDARRPFRIFISAGEVSGDVLGGRLLAALRARCPGGLEIAGIGGEMMRRQGLSSLVPLSDLAMMGLVEVLPHIRRLKRQIAETADAVHAFKPDILVTIDAPGFNKRLAAACGATDFPKVHYVAPTVWAWRPNRVHAFKRLFDRLLCLLPFEPPYFEAVGLDARFVGHSVLESGAQSGDGPAFRRDAGLSPDATVLCILPGSRRGEMDRLLPVFRETTERLSRDLPGLQVAIPVVPHLEERLKRAVHGWPVPIHFAVGDRQKFDAMAASNVAVAASGTVALELALAGLPSTIAYRFNPLTHLVLKRLVKTPYANLVNIMAQQEIVPERIQYDCRPDLLHSDVLRLLGPQGAVQIDRSAPYLAQLRPDGGRLPSDAAAAAILEVAAAAGEPRLSYPSALI